MAITENNQPRKRIIGRTPKVVISPVIDGIERCVHVSLVEQTMNMAKRAAALISGQLRHANGLPVECVIADSCIGGVAEAAAAAQKFEEEGVGISLTVTPCWCYGSETKIGRASCRERVETYVFVVECNVSKISTRKVKFQLRA